MKAVFALALIVFLAGCVQNQTPGPGETRDPETGVTWKSSKLVTLPNGCEIHSLTVDGSFMRLAYCPIGPASVSYTCGKSTCSTGSVPFPSAEEMAKAAALAKLTPSERKALGLKD